MLLTMPLIPKTPFTQNVTCSLFCGSASHFLKKCVKNWIVNYLSRSAIIKVMVHALQPHTNSKVTDSTVAHGSVCLVLVDFFHNGSVKHG